MEYQPQSNAVISNYHSKRHKMFISIRLYKMAFQEWQTGKSCAFAYIVLIMVLAITNIYVKYLNKVKER